MDDHPRVVQTMVASVDTVSLLARLDSTIAVGGTFASRVPGRESKRATGTGRAIDSTELFKYFGSKFNQCSTPPAGSENDMPCDRWVALSGVVVQKSVIWTLFIMRYSIRRHGNGVKTDWLDGVELRRGSGDGVNRQDSNNYWDTSHDDVCCRRIASPGECAS